MPNLAQKWGLDLKTWQRWEDDTTSISLSIESSPLGPDVATRMQDTWEVGSWEKLGSWERMPMDREREKHGDLPFSRTTFTLYPRRIKVFNFFTL